MNEKSGIYDKKELFSKLCIKYPNYKSHIIKEAIHKFDCDFIKIDEHLKLDSMGESTNTSSSDSLRQNSNESGKGAVFSFISLNSVNSSSTSPVSASKNYRPSNELSKISSQRSDLQKLTDAFKRLEKHRDYLNRETLYFGEIIERRKSEIGFPKIIELDTLEMLVNKKYSKPAKYMSYTSDSRKPAEINKQFSGFINVYNSQINNNNNNNNNNSNNMLDRGTCSSSQNNMYSNRDQLNPNLINSPFSRFDEKRYSGNFDSDIHLPEELTGHSQNHATGHRRQKSDPWFLERPNVWDCPQCYTKNYSFNCSFCGYELKLSNVHP